MIKKKWVHGFTLIEVLVALLVLGVGVLGFAGLQLQALKVTSQAFARDQANNLAVDLVERIRVNSDADAKNEYLNPSTWSASGCDAPPDTICATTATASAAICTSVQMARFDAFDVRCTAISLVPSGRIFIDKFCGPGDFPSNAAASANPCIRVAWDDQTWDEGVNTLRDCRQHTNCVELEVVQ